MFVPWLVACGGGIKEDPILRLSAEESLAQGKELLEAEKYSRARDYFNHAFEVEPNSISGREALLLAADTLFLQGGLQNMIQAEAKYRDFLNRFPTSDQTAYVQLQIGNSLLARLEKPDRDQTVTLKALDAFRELLRLYPNSEHAAAAQEKLHELRDRLADHEFIVGAFYQRYGLSAAAIARWEGLLDEYPDYTARDKVLFHLGTELVKRGDTDEARRRFEELRQEFPDSSFARQAAPPEEVSG